MLAKSKLFVTGTRGQHAHVNICRVHKVFENWFEDIFKAFEDFGN